MARIILHIGTHKTATTTLQETLAANRGRLAEHGLIYPKLGRFSGHHTLATHWVKLPQVYYGPVPAAERWRQIVDAHAGTAATVLVSSEEFSRWQPQGVDFAELAAILAPFEERTVVCTLRNQVAYLQSIFLEVTRDHMAAFEPFLAGALRNHHATGVFLDYGALYDHLLTGFAPEEIAFLSFEQAVRQKGGIIGALLARAGLPLLDLAPIDDANVSPEPLAAWAASQIDPARPAALVAQARQALADTFGNIPTTLYTRPEVTRVAAHFAPLNAAFEARYRAHDPGFALAPLALSPNLVYRGQIPAAFWYRFGRLAERGSTSLQRAAPPAR